MNIMYEVYKILNRDNKKAYVGITTQGWQKRVKRHFKDAESGCDFKLHRAIRKYGADNFERTLLETCSTIEELKQRESFWIDVLKLTDDNFGYNMTRGGDGTFGRNHSEKTKDLIGSLVKDRTDMHMVKVEVTDGAKSVFFRTMREASSTLGIPEQTIASRFKKSADNRITVIWDNTELTVIRRDDLKAPSKPKSTKRDPAQVAAHMKMMQDKSVKARKENPEEWKKKSREAKASKVKDIYQWDMDGVLLQVHKGAREAERNTGISRGGIRNCIRRKDYICKEFYWTLENNITEILI